MKCFLEARFPSSWWRRWDVRFRALAVRLFVRLVPLSFAAAFARLLFFVCWRLVVSPCLVLRCCVVDMLLKRHKMEFSFLSLYRFYLKIGTPIADFARDDY